MQIGGGIDKGETAEQSGLRETVIYLNINYLGRGGWSERGDPNTSLGREKR